MAYFDYFNHLILFFCIGSLLEATYSRQEEKLEMKSRINKEVCKNYTNNTFEKKIRLNLRFNDRYTFNKFLKFKFSKLIHN